MSGLGNIEVDRMINLKSTAQVKIGLVKIFLEDKDMLKVNQFAGSCQINIMSC